MKKAILEISNSLGIGGTEKTMQIFCKYLNKDIFNVYACGFYAGGGRENQIRENSKELLLPFGDINIVKKFIKEKKINIVHWHGIPYNKENKDVIELLNFLKENDILIIETAPFCGYNNYINNIIDKKLLVSKTCLLKQNYLFGSQDNFNYLYNPIDVDLLGTYVLSNEEIIKKRKKLGIGDNDFVIGKVGRADIKKWDNMIIDIFPGILKYIPNIKIIIRALPEEKRAELKKKGIEKYFILLPESIIEKDICETYQIMDIMLHTSFIGETFGISLAEAMFFGIPIITKSTDFLKMPWLFYRDNAQTELIEHKKNGFVENSIKKVIKRIYLLKNEKHIYDQISRNNKKKAIKLFDCKRLIVKLEKIFSGIELPKEEGLSMYSYKESIKHLFWDEYGDMIKIMFSKCKEKFFKF